ncbi:MAG TPA: hypothetical protein VJL54_02230, partial [Nitrososphaera sp.]|nr:hypothetical protein [Nitrososphaera sp.]
MTVYPTMVSTASNRFLDYLLGLPLREHSIHDIHLEFQCPNLYQFMRRHFPVGDVNLEIRPKGLLPSGVGLVVRTKDSVGVEIACSNSPFPISPDGIMKFTELLVRTHDRLSEFLVANQEKRLAGSIPHYTDWVVKMWHFGADSAVGYSGEKFELTYKQANSVLFRVYSKELEGKKSSIRMECQELPDKSLIAALVEKLDRL